MALRKKDNKVKSNLSKITISLVLVLTMFYATNSDTAYIFVP